MHGKLKSWNNVIQIGISVVVAAFVFGGTSATAWPLGARNLQVPIHSEIPQILLLVQSEVEPQGTSIEQVQTDLKTLGFYNGAVDGVAGQGTWEALERFWAVAGMEVGDLTIARALHIGATADIVAAGTMPIEEAVDRASELIAVRSQWEKVSVFVAAEDFQRAEGWAISLSSKTGAILGDSHPETLRARSFLANMIEKQGRLSEAEALFREVLEERERTLGAKHPDTLASLGSLLRCALAQGHEEEAGDIMQTMAERMSE
ncbi:MAG: tetratricopeptide repeat protein [Maritimibacter sp.]|nr:tetratricopeptide repeat protein [Maritimibacter sp.]